MALIKKMTSVSKRQTKIHKPTRCEYTIFIGDDGNRYIQFDTFGSAERELPEKISQSIQFNEESAIKLLDLLKRHFFEEQSM